MKMERSRRLRRKEPPPGEATATLLRALHHPLRRRILREAIEHPDTAFSPAELSERWGIALPNLSYHVRVLAALGSIEQCRTEPVRGSLKHYYLPTSRVISDRWLLGFLKSEAGGENGQMEEAA